MHNVEVRLDAVNLSSELGLGDLGALAVLYIKLRHVGVLLGMTLGLKRVLGP